MSKVWIAAAAVLFLAGMPVVLAQDATAPEPAPPSVNENAPPAELAGEPGAPAEDGGQEIPPPAPIAEPSPPNEPEPPRQPDWEQPSPGEPMPPPAARPPVREKPGGRLRPSVVVIGGEKPNSELVVSGKVILVAQIPSKVSGPVTFQMDGTSIATVRAAPYRTIWDTVGISDGPCVLRANVTNEKGEQVWAAEASVRVNNAGTAAAPAVPPGAAGPPRPIAKPGIQERPAIPAAGGETQGAQAYSSRAYGVSINYPAGWKADDQTAKMYPRWNGGFWIVFTPRDGKPQMTLNLRHRRLFQPTTPEKFASYEPYLKSWDRIEVNGKPAFQTTQGTPEAKRVVHRTLIVDGAHVWMLNCIDETGGDPAVSRKIFTDALNSLSATSVVDSKPQNR